MCNKCRERNESTTVNRESRMNTYKWELLTVAKETLKHMKNDLCDVDGLDECDLCQKELPFVHKLQSIIDKIED